MAVIDVAGFVADLKDHAVDHGFHVHDERHFVETYSLRQAWEVDLHPEEACGGPLDLHLALEVDPRVLLAFEDAVLELADGERAARRLHVPAACSRGRCRRCPTAPTCWCWPPSWPASAAPTLPLEVSAIDSFASVTDAAERSLSIVGRVEVSLARVYLGEEQLCDVLDRCLAVSQYLLDRAPAWLGSG